MHQNSISSWITRLFDKRQKQKTLEFADLYDILPEYESVGLTEKLEDAWFDDLKRYPNKPSLFRATVHMMRWQPLLISLLNIPVVRISNQLIPSYSTTLNFIKENCGYNTTVINYIFNAIFSTMLKYFN